MREFDPVLIERARAALAAASVVAEAQASKPGGRTRSGKPETRRPTGEREGLLDAIVQAFALAVDDDALRLAIYRAEAAISRVRRGPAVRPDRRGEHRTGDDRSYQLLVDWEGVAAAEVAVWEGVTIAHVRKLRFDNGRDPQTGEVVEGRRLAAWATPQERADRARQLKARDPRLSARAIGQLLGVSHVTVLTDLAAEKTSGVA
jgi:hypothetical protein